MAKHQIIYTSCKRGIDGVNDGQQVFSYDQGFGDNKSDDIRSLFTYSLPTLPMGQTMTEELATTMPQVFKYRRMKDGGCAVTLNTYLGRDYMGSAGRFGNTLSHSIVTDDDDFNLYPCEMYRSTELRSRMDFDEVNNPNPPAYLPTPNLDCGYAIDVESVVEFIGIGENLDFLKMMYAALLKYEETRNRLIICDSEENIVKWIAALEYILPLDMAKDINFSTYEYDPALSSCRICGVLPEGTKYEPNSYIRAGYYYVFDFVHEMYSEAVVDWSDPYIDFIDTAFGISFGIIDNFNDFLMSKTTCRKINEDLYSAYYLYTMLNDGLSDITETQFVKIVDFEEKNIPDGDNNEIINKILSEQHMLDSVDNSYAMHILGYMLKFINVLSLDEQNQIKRLIVERLITELVTPGTTEEKLLPVYEDINKMAHTVNISIPAELMVDDNRDRLLGMLQTNVELWKVYFVVRIISDYVLDKHMPVTALDKKEGIGAIYFGITKMVLEANRNFDICEKVLSGFEANPNYYTNMAIYMEDYLSGMGFGEVFTMQLWDYFCGRVEHMDEAAYNRVYTLLSDNNRFETMFDLFARKINKASDFESARALVDDQLKNWFNANHGYAQNYSKEVVKQYYKAYKKKLSALSEKEAYKYAGELLDMAMSLGVQDDYVDDLITSMTEVISFTKMDTDDKKFLRSIFEYYEKTLQRPVTGKLHLLLISYCMGKVSKLSTLPNAIEDIRKLGDPSGARFTDMAEGKIKDYLEATFDDMSEFDFKKEDFADIFGLFSLKGDVRDIVVEYWCKLTYKQSKGDKDYTEFAEFLLYLFDVDDSYDRDIVGKYLCKLSKQKLELLDEDMYEQFKRDRHAMHCWEEIRDIASNTSAFKQSFSGLFRKK